MNGSRYSTFLCCMLAVAVSGPATATGSASRIVFSRFAFNPGGSANHINLYRIDAGGTSFRQLTPTRDSYYRWTPRWSPHGTWIVFSQFTTPTAFRYDIHITDKDGVRRRKLTTGTGDYQFPAWSPTGRWIAFKSTEMSGRTCVSVVSPDATAQHELFCPPTAVVQPLAPTWSPKGDCVFIAADYLDADGFHRILVYRVHLATGKATVLGDLPTASNDTLVYFAPGAHRGLLASPEADNGLEVIDFASGSRKGIASGHAPVWSPDGRHIAFGLKVFDQDGQTIDDAFVVDADGSGRHALTSTAAPDDLHYAPADWSPDSRSVLVNRTVFLSSGLPSIRMRIIDATTLESTPLTTGFSGPGGWYKPID